VALRPNSGIAFLNLGAALEKMGRLDEALAAYHKVIDLDPQDAVAYGNLGGLLNKMGRRDEAIAACRKAIELDPRIGGYHNNLGIALFRQGRLDEALVACRKAIELQPNDAMAHGNLGLILAKKGQTDDAIAAYRQAIKLNSHDGASYHNLSDLLEKKDRLEDSIAVCRQAIHFNPSDSGSYNNLGVALFRQGRLDDALAAFNRAAALDSSNPRPQFNRGHVLMRQGRFREAVFAFRCGQEALGAQTPSENNPLEQWLREAEQRLRVDDLLPKILAGDATPRETLDYAGLCYLFRRQYMAAAHLCEQAFAQQPELEKDVKAGHRYHAACAAAQAGCGQGDAARLDNAKRAHWRARALAWLHADLTWWTERLEKSDTPEVRLALQQQMRQWQDNIDLAGLREREGLAKLPNEEREAWRKLWADVEALRQRTK
jgi:tetratricopeptide (TPR) repeat protein